MTIRRIRFLFATVPILLLCSLAWAQAPAPAPVDPVSLLTQLLSFATTGHGLAATGVAMSLFVWAVRSEFAAKWAFWKTKLGGYLLGYGIPMLAYLGLAFVAPGAHVTIQVIGSALAAGLASAGFGRTIDHAMSSFATPSSGAGGGTAKTAMRVLMVIAVATLLSSGCKTNCTDPKNAGSVECKIVNAVVSCTGVSSLSTGVAVVEPIVAGLIAGAMSASGTISFAAIEPQLLQLAWKYGGCVIAQVWDDLTGSGGGSGSASTVVTTAGSNAPASARFGVTASGLPKFDSAQMKAEFERLRAKVAPGQTFTLASGSAL